MPKYIPSIPIDDCYGSVGDLTFYHRNGQCYYRKRATPVFPGTVRQMEHQEIHLRAIAAWQDLEPAVQEEWNRCAVGVQSHRPPYDGKSGISGYNLFVSAYHGFARLGQEHTPPPAPWVNFPVFSVDSVDVVDRVDGSLKLGFQIHMPPKVEAGRYWLLTRLQLAKPGEGVHPGLMRTYLASAGCLPGQSVVEVEIPDYVATWGLELSSYKVHCRYLLIDSSTGYRNSFRRYSGEINL